ncbi:MAG: nicotinate-nucleotide--dimethylbenzimidazole phosphoribosyltransferase [Acidimicrobiia bacterium]
MSSLFAAAAAAVRPLDAVAEADAAALQDRLTKPRGALGRLEEIGVRLAAIAGGCPPPVPSPAAVAVFAADHGVVAEGVTAWPQEVTAQMVANISAGGAAINVLARQAGASATVIDVGVACALPAGCDVRRRVVRAGGTANLVREPAMTVAECSAALDVGAEVAAALVAGGAKALVTGEMGIGNTTSAAALIAAFTGRPPAVVTGRGAGVDDAGLTRKVAVVEAALARHAGAVAAGPLATLAALGGLEIAALAGFVVGGAAAAVPVVVDGVIAGAGLLAAERLAPGVARRCFAGHRSVEPGATAVLEELGMEPVLDLGLRLGEGTGACLALAVVEASARVLREMATFDGAGVSDKGDR